MKLQFSTLFNSAYLARGLAMYRSLEKVCGDFHLYVFAFDDLTLNYFQQNSLPNLTVVSLREFEDPVLLGVKSDRTAGEYCWTCTSSTILYCIKRFGLDHCTYIDADMSFYSDPRVLFEEMGENSVLITEHRYTKSYDQSATSGIYCVQYVTFRNDERGMTALRWWRSECIKWCYNRSEDGKFGDQKYLDDWMTRFDGVHELKHLGGGVAPWNLQQYDVLNGNETLWLKRKDEVEYVPIIFFHFHGLRFYQPDIIEFSGAGYSISRLWKKLVYRPYGKTLFAIEDELKASLPVIGNPNGISQERRTSHFSSHFAVWRSNSANLLRYILGRRNSFRRMENHLYKRSEL